MKNRYMPYGYGMAQGKIIVIRSEAEIIRRIFKEYLSGDSLKTIAGTLTAEKSHTFPTDGNGTKIALIEFSVISDTSERKNMSRSSTQTPSDRHRKSS